MSKKHQDLLKWQGINYKLLERSPSQLVYKLDYSLLVTLILLAIAMFLVLFTHLGSGLARTSIQEKQWVYAIFGGLCVGLPWLPFLWFAQKIVFYEIWTFNKTQPDITVLRKLLLSTKIIKFSKRNILEVLVKTEYLDETKDDTEVYSVVFKVSSSTPAQIEATPSQIGAIRSVYTATDLADAESFATLLKDYIRS